MPASAYDRILECLDLLREGKRPAFAMQCVGLLESDLQRIAEQVEAVQFPPHDTKGPALAGDLHQGVSLLMQAARKVREFAVTRREPIAQEATRLALEGQRLAQAADMAADECIEELIDE